ncbi:UNVERIFIED_CONTAM: hypothetical protein Slati_3698400 [Sesamum latifolium]|uniref:Uncharacterized protein n=1 Tax=Sesamum latifolium TaxID=2727402 RepID=A0AAW2U2M1_9LAMI
MHENLLVTVVYGANGVDVRRMLWQELGDLARNIVDEAWLACGDFNVVLDMSGFCGASADIRQVMEEFQQCVIVRASSLYLCRRAIHMAQL